MQSKNVLLIAGDKKSKVKDSVKNIIKILNQKGFQSFGLLENEHSTHLLAKLNPHKLLANLDIKLIKKNQIKEIDLDFVISIGGDGTFLAAAQYAKDFNIPILGINKGSVGFLTEVESENLNDIFQKLSEKKYDLELRTTIEAVFVENNHANTNNTSWALNEILIQNKALNGVLNLNLSIDSRSISNFICDGMIVSTPTGSTAYAYSAGGPILWPDLDAMVIVPSNAHAIFKDPLVINSKSIIELAIENNGVEIALIFDGKRFFELNPDSRIIIRKGSEYIKIIKIKDSPFSEKLVKKFNLDNIGWKK